MSHFLEAAGIATTGISLVRENTEQMQLPRFLWVPFELGRPFGAPNEPDFQRRVLQTALELLERKDGPVILEDFPDDAPVATDSGSEGWACPVSFHLEPEHESALVRETLDEITQLAPWHEVFEAQGGRAAPAAGPLAPPALVHALGDVADGRLEPDIPTDLPLVEWMRLGCDDVRTWYMEAARGQPARPRAAELDDWFWRQTALARLIARAATVLAESPDPGLRVFGRRSMVPRSHMRELMPGIEPSIGDMPKSR